MFKKKLIRFLWILSTQFGIDVNIFFKAFLEIVANSIDAKAKGIIIEIIDNTILIFDILMDCNCLCLCEFV